MFRSTVDYKLHNYTREIAFDIDKKYNTGFIAARLSQHITLGQLFEVDDPYEVEEYFDLLAKGLKVTTLLKKRLMSRCTNLRNVIN